MRLAFYAPLKAPDHPVPSGDRTMARSLLAAFAGMGIDVTQPSDLRSRDGRGDATVQSDIMAKSTAALPDLIAQGRAEGWQAWLTYHNYYKAPDLLGPHVAQALGIPYLLIEATRAKKRLTGPWANFAAAAEAATDAAQTVFYLTKRDAEALKRDAPSSQHLIHLRPFLNRADLPKPSQLNGPILSVGMMRHADKLASYEIIAQTLVLLPVGTWHLNIAGDGLARAEVAALMAPFGDAVTFLGALDEAALTQAYQSASIFFWPGVNEAFGLSYLEAQAAGLPVVAQDRPGVRDVLAPGDYPLPDAGPKPLADRLSALLNNPSSKKTASQTALAHIDAHHLLPAAQHTLRAGLTAAGITL